MKQRFGADATLVKGAGGVFDVVVDGETAFSKHHVGRFPEPGEVESAIAGLLKDR